MPTTYRLSGEDWRILGLLPTEWAWRRIGQVDTDLDHLQPATSAWIPAQVPGDVQSDLRDAGEIPDPWYERNSRACEWTSDRDWVYRKEFTAPPEMRSKWCVRLRFGGVDFSCHVFLNGKHLGDHIGMYDPFDFEVTDILDWEAPNRLLVVIDHAPKEPEVQGQIGYTNQIRLWKARFAYDWDWCTRLIPLGIWQDVTLEADDGIRITDLRLETHLYTNGDEGSTHTTVATHAAIESTEELPVSLHVTLYNPEGQIESTDIIHAGASPDGPLQLYTSHHLASPRLWYPNGSGPQSLYVTHVSVKSEAGEILEERTGRFGIREAKFVPNDNAPKDALPYVLEVNGTKTFLKGWNWVPLDQLYGRPHAEKYRHLIRLAQEANCNLLRVWGGGLLERELFYDLCDQAGIFVWQEFIQSSSGIDNEASTDLDYIAYCRAQAEKMIIQRRNHPSLLLWCGGNELMTSDWTPLSNAHPNMAALKETVERLDPGRPFLPTSPSGPLFGADPNKPGQMHDVHGNWTYLGDPEHYRFFNAIDPLLHSEFGVEGATNIEALPRFLSPDALWPPDRSNPAWTFHGAWWLNREKVEALFGPIDTIEDFVRASQWVQAEGLRYGVEANRRRKWRTAGTIPWQFNEAWPNSSCTNVVDYYGQPKPAYWSLKRAYAPLQVSAKYDKIRWEPGEEFLAEAWLNRSYASDARLGGKVRLRWHLFDLLTGEMLKEDIATAPLAAVADAPLRLATVCYRLPKDYRGIFALRLGAMTAEIYEDPHMYDIIAHYGLGDQGFARNEYLFSTHASAPFAPLLRLPPARVQTQRMPAVAAERGSQMIQARNLGDVPALYLTLALPEAPLGIVLPDNYRTLLPNERAYFPVIAETEALPEVIHVTVSAWNMTPRRLKF